MEQLTIKQLEFLKKGIVALKIIGKEALEDVELQKLYIILDSEIEDIKFEENEKL